MMMGEFATLLQHELPVKVIVLNNGTLGFVEMEMKASGFLDTGCDLKDPDFAAMANAIGIKGIRVEATRRAIRGARNTRAPRLLTRYRQRSPRTR